MEYLLFQRKKSIAEFIFRSIIETADRSGRAV
jgi:hypothetical protein